MRGRIRRRLCEWDTILYFYTILWWQLCETEALYLLYLCERQADRDSNCSTDTNIRITLQTRQTYNLSPNLQQAAFFYFYFELIGPPEPSLNVGALLSTFPGQTIGPKCSWEFGVFCAQLLDPKYLGSNQSLARSLF